MKKILIMLGILILSCSCSNPIKNEVMLDSDSLIIGVYNPALKFGDATTTYVITENTKKTTKQKFEKNHLDYRPVKYKDENIYIDYEQWYNLYKANGYGSPIKIKNEDALSNITYNEQLNTTFKTIMNIYSEKNTSIYLDFTFFVTEKNIYAFIIDDDNNSLQKNLYKYDNDELIFITNIDGDTIEFIYD